MSRYGKMTKEKKFYYLSLINFIMYLSVENFISQLIN